MLGFYPRIFLYVSLIIGFLSEGSDHQTKRFRFVADLLLNIVMVSDALCRFATCQGKTKFSPGQGKVREF